MKGMRSLEVRKQPDARSADDESLRRKLITPNAERVYYLYAALERDWTVDELHDLTKIDIWFLTQLQQIVELQREVAAEDMASIPRALLRQAKRYGFSDARLADLLGGTENELRAKRKGLNVVPVYKRVDT